MRTVAAMLVTFALGAGFGIWAEAKRDHGATFSFTLGPARANAAEWDDAGLQSHALRANDFEMSLPRTSTPVVERNVTNTPPWTPPGAPGWVP